MKLTNLFWRDRKRADRSDDVAAPGRLGSRLGNDAADHSSMADLVRLLKEADDAQKGGGRQPA